MLVHELKCMNTVHATWNRQLYVLIKFPVEFDWFFDFCIFVCFKDCIQNAVNVNFANPITHIVYTYVNYWSIRKSPAITSMSSAMNWKFTKHDANDHESDYIIIWVWQMVLCSIRPIVEFIRRAHFLSPMAQLLFHLLFFASTSITYACLTPILHIFWNITAFGISYIHSYCFFVCTGSSNEWTLSHLMHHSHRLIDAEWNRLAHTRHFICFEGIQRPQESYAHWIYNAIIFVGDFIFFMTTKTLPFLYQKKHVIWKYIVAQNDIDFT